MNRAHAFACVVWMQRMTTLLCSLVNLFSFLEACVISLQLSAALSVAVGNWHNDLQSWNRTW